MDERTTQERKVLSAAIAELRAYANVASTMMIVDKLNNLNLSTSASQAWRIKTQLVHNGYNDSLRYLRSCVAEMLGVEFEEPKIPSSLPVAIEEHCPKPGERVLCVNLDDPAWKNGLGIKTYGTFQYVDGERVWETEAHLDKVTHWLAWDESA